MSTYTLASVSATRVVMRSVLPSHGLASCVLVLTVLIEPPLNVPTTKNILDWVYKTLGLIIMINYHDPKSIAHIHGVYHIHS
jgi:hypothetical protein